MDSEKRIVEIDGIKLEIDLRTAKKIENYRIGDNVKVLVPSYGNNFKVHPGVIVGFDAFEKLPTICVAYLESAYNTAEIKFAYLNAATKDGEKIEIAPAHDLQELHFQKADVLSIMQGMIDKKEEEKKDLERKKEYFSTYFSKYFEPTEAQANA